MKKEPDKLWSKILADIILIFLIGFGVFGLLLLMMQFI